MASAFSSSTQHRKKTGKYSFEDAQKLVKEKFDFTKASNIIEEKLDEIRKLPKTHPYATKNARGEITKFHTSFIVDIASEVSSIIKDFYDELGIEEDSREDSRFVRETRLTRSQMFEPRKPLTLDTIRVHMWIIALRSALPVYQSELSSLHVVLWNELLKTALKDEAVVTEIQKLHKTIRERKTDKSGKKIFHQAEFIVPFLQVSSHYDHYIY